jgi:hypothetical protein
MPGLKDFLCVFAALREKPFAFFGSGLSRLGKSQIIME